MLPGWPPIVSVERAGQQSCFWLKSAYLITPLEGNSEQISVASLLRHSNWVFIMTGHLASALLVATLHSTSTHFVKSVLMLQPGPRSKTKGRPPLPAPANRGRVERHHRHRSSGSDQHTNTGVNDSGPRAHWCKGAKRTFHVGLRCVNARDVHDRVVAGPWLKGDGMLGLLGTEAGLLDACLLVGVCACMQCFNVA